jgi:hypothetical protein
MAQIRSLPNFLDPRLVLTHCDRVRFFEEVEKKGDSFVLECPADDGGDEGPVMTADGETTSERK